MLSASLTSFSAVRPFIDQSTMAREDISIATARYNNSRPIQT